MTANDCKSHHFINKKPINGVYSALMKKLRPLLKLRSLKLMIEPESQSIRIFLVTFTLKIGQEKYLLSILFWKLILGLIKLQS